MTDQKNKDKRGWINGALLTVALLSLVGAAMLAILMSTAINWVYGLLGVGGGLILLLLIFNFKKTIEFFGKRQVIFGINTILIACLVLGILGLLNYLGHKNPKEIDFTENQINTLSEQSVKVASNLSESVLVTVILQSEQQTTKRAILEKYERYSGGKFTFRFLDPIADPVEVKNFLGSKVKTARMGMASLTVNADDPTSSREIQIDEVTEEKLTNGLIKLTKGKRPKIYFVQGHGELELSSSAPNGLASLKETLESSGNDVNELRLAGLKEIPKDCSLLVIAGASQDYHEVEIGLVRSYLNNNGRALIFVEPHFEGSGTQNLTALLSDFGVTVVPSVILDPLSFGNAALIAVFEYSKTHPITSEFSGQTIFPVAVSLKKGTPPPGLSVELIAKAGPKSWGEVDTKSLSKVKPTFKAADGDIPGPVTVGFAVQGVMNAKVDPYDHDDGHDHEDGAEEPKKEKEAGLRLVVVGDSEFIGNQLANTANRDLFLNMVNWATENEDLISIPPKKEKQVQFDVTAVSLASVDWITIVFAPFFLLGASVFVYIRRRRL